MDVLKAAALAVKFSNTDGDEDEETLDALLDSMASTCNETFVIVNSTVHLSVTTEWIKAAVGFTTFVACAAVEGSNDASVAPVTLTLLSGSDADSECPNSSVFWTEVTARCAGDAALPQDAAAWVARAAVLGLGGAPTAEQRTSAEDCSFAFSDHPRIFEKVLLAVAADKLRSSGKFEVATGPTPPPAAAGGSSPPPGVDAAQEEEAAAAAAADEPPAKKLTPSTYMEFAGKARQRIQTENPEWDMGQVMRTVAAEWKTECDKHRGASGGGAGFGGGGFGGGGPPGVFGGGGGGMFQRKPAGPMFTRKKN
jgi:uncharacterized membrane protein YgcG